MAIEAREANLFEFEDTNLRISYSTSSLDGRPRLSYRDETRERAFAGEEIRTVDTEIGKQVTVTLETVPDLHTLTLTLLIAAVRLEGECADLTTSVLFTTHHTSIAGPRLVKGPLQSYSSRDLKGQAKSVVF